MGVILGEPEFFHYTSFEALVGIVRSRALWATSIHYLNDEREFRHGHEELCRFIESRSRQSEGPEARAFQVLHGRVQNWIHPHVFVFSLSPIGDQLSQWRGYCPDGAGVSIGFAKSFLEQRAARFGFSLLPCMYGRHEQSAAIVELLDAYLVAANNRPEHVETLAGQYMMKAVQLMPRLKHPSFAEEQEWRLISPPLCSATIRSAP